MAVCDTSNSTKVGNGDITSAPTLIDSNNFMYMHPFDNIGAMLVPEIVDSVGYVQNFAELWKELEDRYGQKHGGKLYQIQQEINDLSHGSLDIIVFYTKLKNLWEELNTLNTKAQCTCSCTCGAKEIFYKCEQDRRIVQFRMGLNEIYTLIRGSILMMNPLPAMEQVFSLLVQDERQRETNPSNHLTLDSTALHDAIDKRTRYNTNYSTNNSTNLKYKDRFCSYCTRTCHLIEKCYHVHGYPPGHNNSLNQNRNTQSAQREPESYTEVVIDPAWKLVMTQEFDVLHSNHTWDLVPLPPGRKL
ncbi:uncharacterized protein [Solanum lycopersicum]|uniref:uncharacterized protein n=1 Tax=Solanum lycopersicum TaxID=4081 RepID=UPI000532ADEC|nr:uncharacterized protein LOC104648281 [Solanum lycopersicum]